MKEYRYALISSYVVGLLFGILLATVMVFLLRTIVMNPSIYHYILITLIVAALPFCVLSLRRFGLSYLIVSLCMLGVSLLISLGYGLVMQNGSMKFMENSTLFTDIAIRSIIWHGLMLIVTLVIYFRTIKASDDTIK
ncbi:MAG: hypothetical protein IJ875_07170 [Solobacterium sp.]|nr:hypothetical protein [Solobacterium sp.]